MTQSPFFSVVVPTYNRREIIGKTIESVLEQTFSSFELIVVDDGSTDGTDKLVEGYNDPKIIYLWQENSGTPGAARNSGIKIARGKYVAFLDSDDWWYPDKLQEVYDAVIKNQECVMVTHLADVYDCTAEGIAKKVATTRRPLFNRATVFESLLLDDNPFVLSATSVRKDVLDEVGGFCDDKRLCAIQDYDLWIRLSKITENIVIIPKSLAGYRRWNENMIKDSYESVSLHVKELMFLFPQHLKDYEGDRLQAKAIYSSMYHRQAVAAHRESRWLTAAKFYMKSMDPADLQRSAKAFMSAIRCLRSIHK